MTSELRLLVVSDIHVAADEMAAADTSQYYTNMAEQRPGRNPFERLADLLGTSADVKPDLLVCCGDISDRAHPSALVDGWSQLAALVRKCGISGGMLATAGNHDVDSRFGHADYDARGILLDLVPGFPCDDRVLSNEYWARNYCIIEANHGTRIVLLNSAAYHGEGVSERNRSVLLNGDGELPLPEYEHGRVSARTLHALLTDLDGRSPADLNVLICHHHPFRSDHYAAQDPSEMEGGLELLEALSMPQRGRWIIVHGHRHIGAIQHFSGMNRSNAPILFCASSMAKVLPSSWPSVNQVHYVELRSDGPRAIKGRFRSWSWNAAGGGWVPAGSAESLPGTGGFGFSGDVSALASQIEAHLKQPPGRLMSLQSLAGPFPDLPHVDPGDRNVLLHELRGKGIRVTVEPDDGTVYLIAEVT